MSDEPSSTPPSEEREFEDLNLAEAAGDLLRQPFGTLRREVRPERRPSALEGAVDRGDRGIERGGRLGSRPVSSADRAARI